MPRSFSCWIALAAVLWLPASAASAQKVPVLQITGQNNHDWLYTSKIIETVLEGTGIFDVTTTTDPKATLADAAAVAGYRCFFLNYNGERWGEPAETVFLDAVRRGVGVFVLHAANNPFVGWTEYEKMMGLCWREGAGHGRYHAFDVKVVDRNHPVTIDLPDMKAHPDELYHKLTPTPGAEWRVLMSAHAAQETGGTGQDEPMALVLKYGAGRVFHTPLGHVWPGVESSRTSFADPQLHLLIARGTEWAATGRCTVTPESFAVAPLPVTGPRPHDPWVLRCVLDGRPRILVAALHHRLWVAYDTESATFWRAWPGGVAFEGAARDGAPGPWPTTLGKPYRSGAEKPWHLKRRDGATVTDLPCTVSWAGHRVDKNALVLEWRLQAADIDPKIVVKIDESPEVVAADPVQWRRRFTVTGLPDGLELWLDLDESGAKSRTKIGPEPTEVYQIFTLRDDP